MNRPQKRALIAFTSLIFVILATFIIGTLARGYRFDFKEKSLKPTGLLVANSIPNGAQVWIDSKLKTATNQTIALPPGQYKVEIKKPGYSTWEKNLQINKEIAVTTDAHLFPLAPDLKALGFTGIINPNLSPDGTKVVYFIPPADTTASPSSEITTAPIAIDPLKEIGVGIINLTEKTLKSSFKPRILAKTRPDFNFDQATIEWSPDSRKILLTIIQDNDKKYFILDVNQTYDFTILPIINTPPAQVLKTIAKWQNERELEKKGLFSKLPEAMKTILKEKCQNVTFSPTETKILYQAAEAIKIPEKLITKEIISASTQKEERNLVAKNWYVYDLKEDKNFLILKEENSKKTQIRWFPTSKHLLLVEKGKKIEIVEYDGTNRITVYAGPFENDFVFPFPSGKSLLISTSLNSNKEKFPHLYAISLQ